MAKPRKKQKPEEIETDPGAWDRFEHAVDAAAKSGPKHRIKPNPRQTKKDDRHSVKRSEQKAPR
jgi:hypothetical protein